jgi:hypothetical protein
MHAVSKKLAAVRRKLIKTFDQPRSMGKRMIHAPLAPFLRLRQQAQCVSTQDDAISMREQVPQSMCHKESEWWYRSAGV